jgi:ATP-dependent Clp protease ATP-binding subunit ClpA
MRVALGEGLETRSPRRMKRRSLFKNCKSGKLEEDKMENHTKDDRDILELLKEELAFVEQGGYGRSVRTPWLPKSAFQDSLACLNYADPDHGHACSECGLMNFVEGEHQSEKVPCHYIPLNEAGETIEDLEAQDNQAKLEATLKQWMRIKINEMSKRERRKVVEQTVSLRRAVAAQLEFIET